MTDVKRNRTLAGGLAHLLNVAERIPEGRIELTQFETRTRNNQRVKRVRALLMHEGDGPALQGIGPKANDAVKNLEDAIDLFMERRK